MSDRAVPDRDVLKIRGLTVRYPASSCEAIRDVSFELQPGTLTAVQGRNGAGKSTLCLAAAGLLPRVVRAEVRGDVLVDGVVATADGQAGRPVRAGLVLADPATGLTGARASVRDEVAFGLENLGVERGAMDARINHALDALGVAHLAGRAPESLSGGEQQRVAIAAAVAMESPLLVLDEAAAELDPAGAASLADLLRGLRAGGTAVLAAEHARAILDAADRTLLLDDGALVSGGGPAVSTQPPGSVVTAGAAPRWDVGNAVAPVGVEIRGLTHRYPNGIEALRSIDLRIEPGEAVAIVGGNGSGKSTLAKHLVGLLRATEGSVMLDGRGVASTPVEDHARRVGYLFQDPREQLFGRTVEAAVAFGPGHLRLPERQRAALVDAALFATGLVDRRTANPHDLDLAARKQVALAGALAMDPGLLLLDEPTTGQDEAGLARVEGVLAAIRRAGRTVVAVTHDLPLAARAFDRIIRLDRGRVVADERNG